MNCAFDDARRLGFIRIGVFFVFLVSVARSSYQSIGYLPITTMHPPGIMEYLSWKAYDRLLTPQAMLLLQVVTLVALICGLVGLASKVTTKISATAIVLMEGILGSFGHTFAGRNVGMWFLIILAISPCGDALSIDSRLGRSTFKNGWTYRYPVLMMQGYLAWTYCASGLNKLRHGGWEYFGADNIRLWCIRNSVHNLHDTQFTFAMHLEKFSMVLVVATVAVVIWEISFPVILVWRSLTIPYLLMGVGFHLGTWLLMNLTFWNHLAMYLVFIDWLSVERTLHNWIAHRKRTWNHTQSSVRHEREIGSHNSLSQ